ncbi:MAG: sigma-70 family RNA polymerase sigma factor [Thermoleophilia bacterium]
MSDVEDLYRRTAPELLGYLVRRVRVREDAADLLAELYLLAWRRRDALPAPPDDRLWLFGAARRLVLAHHRDEVRRHAAASDLRELLAVAPAPQDASDEPDPRVRRALAALPEPDRELLTLTVWEGLTPAQAAAIAGIRPGAARVRLHRARRRLASALGSADPESVAAALPRPTVNGL